MAWLVDTNVLSELRRLKTEPKVLAFIAGHPLDQLYISAVTLAELRFGIELLSEGSSRRDELNDWLTLKDTAHVRPAVFAGYRRHHVQVADCGGRRPKSGTHVFAVGGTRAKRTRSAR